MVFGAAWITGLRRSARQRSPLPDVRVQLVALALLLIILFPAISLSDDLQACTTPVEVEHLARQDHQFLGDYSPQAVPVTLVMLVTGLEPAYFQRAGFLGNEESTHREVTGYSRSLANRPPPPAA